MSVDNLKRYIGQFVSVNETLRTMQFKSIGTQVFTEYELDEANSVIDELRKEAEHSGLKLRVFLPGTMGTTDYRMDRVNVRIEKYNGVFRVASVDIG